MCAICKLTLLFIRVPNFVDNSLCQESNKQDEQNAKPAVFTRMSMRVWKVGGEKKFPTYHTHMLIRGKYTVIIDLWVWRCGCGYVAVIVGVLQLLRPPGGTRDWPLYRVPRWPFFRGLHTTYVYVSLIGTRAVGRYMADGRCWEVTVKRGSTVDHLRSLH